MKKNFSVAVVVPALNEEEGLRRFLPRIDRSWYDELIVVDGNSHDKSQEFVRTFGCTLVIQKSKGYEGALIEGMQKSTSDVIIIFSPDGNCVPESIPLLIESVMKGNEMVIASRYLSGMKSEDDTFFTAFGNWFFTKLINICFGTHYTDSLVNYRAYRRHVAKRFLLEHPENIYILEPAMSIECALNNIRTAEVPGFEPPRLTGHRKTFIIKPTIRIFRYILKSLVFGSPYKKSKNEVVVSKHDSEPISK